MFCVLLNKRSYRPFLRRLGLYSVLVSNSDRAPKNLHETLERPEKKNCKRILIIVLSVPILLYFYLLVPPSPREEVVTVTAQYLELEVSTADYAALKKLYFRGLKAPIKTVEEAVVLLKRPPMIHHKQSDNLTINVDFATVKADTTTTKTTTTTKSKLPECLFNVSAIIDYEIKPNTSIGKISLNEIYPMVHEGGYYKPADCWTKNRVAVVVPYRNRTRNLSTFLFNMHPFLMKQKLEYRIFVIEQFDNVKEFNKGRLLNAGFLEMQKYGDWLCVVFHDVDLLPLDARISYTCPNYPRHMSSNVVNGPLDKKTNSPMLFGGVTMMQLKHYKRANGHSNLYWGWGGEDYDMFWRIRAAFMPVVRYNKTIAKYLSLPHRPQLSNPARYKLLHHAIDRWRDEGLSDVRYSVISVQLRHLFTHIVVDINPYKEVINAGFPAVQNILRLEQD